MEAAISASQGAMRSLPGKLESLLSGTEYGLRAEEKNKIRILQAELQEIIDNYLLEPSEVESPALTASSWMMDLRDLSYDIDDFIYELAHVCGGGARISVVRKPPRIKISRFPERLKRRQWITEEISGFRIRVKEAIEWHKEYLGNCKWRPSSNIRLGEVPQSPCRKVGIRLVGLISSIEQLFGWLANDGRQPEHRVASIVGTGGVGKTTLAREMYRKLGGQFECLAFVRTSRKPDTKVLLASILSQVQQHQLPDAPDVHELVHRINAHLQDKTYLIVIDDLWELSTWDIVNRALPKGRCCGRILTTTEVIVIAQKCCADNSKCMSAKNEDNSMYIPSKIEDNYKYIIKKGPLCEDESRELFLSTAFGLQAESLPQRFKEVSDEIIKISGGLPLAVKLLASLLGHAADSSLEQWKYIKKSLGSCLTTNNSLEVINQVLTLGYDNLPHGLKACMLYLCMYEEDSVIFMDDLVKQWITEGFISALEGGDRVEVARSYLHELVNRGLIQPVDMDSNDEILSCSVHHMVLDFIRYKSIEENFSIAIDHSQTTMKLADKVRRLALHFGNVEGATPPAPSCMRLSKIRSLAFSGFLKSMPSIVEFRFLQVLVLKLWADSNNRSDSLTGSNDLSDKLTEPDDLSYNLTEISQLFRLRYFRLDACHLSVELPTQMQRLQDLMVWEIDADVTSFPSDIVDLPGLFYVSLPSKAYLPTGIGRMTSLRTLGVIDLSKNSTGNVMSLGELTNLQDLRLTCSILQRDNLEKNLECLGSIIRKLSNLRYVTLVPAVSSRVNTQDDASASCMSISWHGFSMVPLPPALLQRLELSRRCCILSSLPEWTKELTKLCTLKIAIRKVSSEDIIVLKGLPSLTALSLFVWTVPARRIMFDDEGFSVLKYFKFVCAAPCLEFLDGAMTNVRMLKLGFNANRMERFRLTDAGFERLTSLNEISAKIGIADADEYRRRFAKSVLTGAISRHPRTPVINVQLVDWDFSGVGEKYIEAQREIWNQTPEREDVAEVESPDEHGIQEKSLKGDAEKQADMRTYMPPESTSHMHTAGGASGKRENPYTGTEADEQASDRTKGSKVTDPTKQKAAGEASESGSKEVDQDRVIAHKVQATEIEEVLDALGAKEEADNFQLVLEVHDLLSDSDEDVAALPDASHGKTKLHNPGNLRLPLIEKHTTGIYENQEVDSGYGDIYSVLLNDSSAGFITNGRESHNDLSSWNEVMKSNRGFMPHLQLPVPPELGASAEGPAVEYLTFDEVYSDGLSLNDISAARADGESFWQFSSATGDSAMENSFAQNNGSGEAAISHPFLKTKSSNLSDILKDSFKKSDSFTRWMSNELPDVEDSQIQSSSGAYWNTGDADSIIEASSREPQDQFTVAPMLSQDQLFSIVEFSPSWTYAVSKTKVLVTGRLLNANEVTERCKWSCMFGEVEVPAEISSDGTLRCYSPPHKPGRVPFYITCSNRLACSEVREFEFRPSDSQYMDAPSPHGATNKIYFQIRLDKLLSLGQDAYQATISNPSLEMIDLSKKISLLMNNSDEWSELLKLADDNELLTIDQQDQFAENLIKEKLHFWLLHKAGDGGKGPSVVDDEGQGVLHLAAALGYDWAIRPTVTSGVNINFRDVHGWTALHWAAFCGRERTVVALIALGAAPGALTDPTPDFPGCTPADLASANGHKGISGFLAESSLTSHLQALNLKETNMAEISGLPGIGDVTDRSSSQPAIGDSLSAVRNAAQAAARIYQFNRIQSFQRKQAVQYEDDKSGISDERALPLMSLKSSRLGKLDPLHAAASRIQNKYRGWKGRKEFLLIRQRIVKIQAHVRGHQVRKHYRKIIWSVGIVEKVILRWRRRGAGLRGFRSSEGAVESSSGGTSTNLITHKPAGNDYDFLQEGRKQTEDRLQKALARVKSMAQYPEARDQYQRILTVVSKMQESQATQEKMLEDSAEMDEGSFMSEFKELWDDGTPVPGYF